MKKLIVILLFSASLFGQNTNVRANNGTFTGTLTAGSVNSTNATVSGITLLKNQNKTRYASQFTGADACIQAKSAVADLPTSGGVVKMDYEGTGTQACSANPFGARVGNTNQTAQIQLGAFPLQVTHQILIPQKSQLVGLGRGSCNPSDGTIVSCIKADPTFTTSCAISSWSVSSNVVTVNTTTSCNLESGVKSIVRIIGAANGGSGGSINTAPSSTSQYLVTPVTSTQFTFSLTLANQSGVAGGTVYVPLIVLGDVAAAPDVRLEHVGIEANSLANLITVYSNSINEHSGLSDVYINDSAFKGVLIEHTNTSGPPSNWFFQDVEINGVSNQTNWVCFQILGAFNDQRGMDHFTCNGASATTVSSWSRSANVVSLVTPISMNVAIGQQIVVSNSTQGATTNINGTWILTNVSGTTVQFSQTAANDSAAAGGTVDFAATGTVGFLLDGVSGLWSRLHAERVVDGMVIGSQPTTASTWAPQVMNLTGHQTVTNTVRLENTSTPSYVGLFGLVKEGGINILKDNINSRTSTQVALGMYTLGLNGTSNVLTTDITLSSQLPGNLTLGGGIIGGPNFINTDNLSSGVVFTETTASGNAAGKDACYGDSTAHALECSFNNDTFKPVLKANNINGVATILNGAPAVVAKADATAQAANIGSTLLYAVPANGAGLYCASAYSTVTQAATTSSTLAVPELNWTDPDSSTAITMQVTSNSAGVGPGSTGSTNNTVGTTVSGKYCVNAKASTNINYLTVNYASVGATVMQFAVHIKLEYLGN